MSEQAVPEYKPIPIGAAKQIAAKFDKAQVIIVTWDAVHGRTHITSYGTTVEGCRQAAMAAKAVAIALRCGEIVQEKSEVP